MGKKKNFLFQNLRDFIFKKINLSILDSVPCWNVTKTKRYQNHFLVISVHYLNFPYIQTEIVATESAGKRNNNTFLPLSPAEAGQKEHTCTTGYVFLLTDLFPS